MQCLPIGVMTALLGSPLFIYLAQRKVHTSSTSGNPESISLTKESRL
jgi:hypothetical protein